MTSSKRGAKALFGHYSPSLPLDSLKHRNALIYQAQIFSSDGQNPTVEPSKFFAFDFKGKFARFRILRGFDNYRQRSVNFSRRRSRERILRQDEKDRQHL